MRKKRVFLITKLMLITETTRKLDKIVTLCFTYIGMRKNNLRRYKNEEKEKKTG